MGVIVFFMLWALYGFAVGTVSGAPSVPLPAPRHWAGVLFQVEHLDKPIVYVLGKWRPMGWLGFFPLTFLIKNPLPLLFGVLLGIGILVHKRRWWHKLEILGLFSLLYVLLAITVGPNLGYRYMLPIHPLLYMVIASGVVWIWPRLRQVGRWGIVALGVWYVVGTLRVYPYNLAFFNELAGGPANGWRYLEGSNTDWGQGWKALREFREDQALTYSYSGPEGYARTASYDLWDRPLPPLNYVLDPLFRPWLFPEPGDYVLSANTLSGSFLVDPDNFAWFRYHDPDSVIGHTLYYYHVDATLAPTWLAQCTLPAAPLSADAVAEGFGHLSLRSIPFDCDQSWVYPDGGATRGMYGLHGATLKPETWRERLNLTPARPVDAFVDRHLADVPLAFRQWDYRELPAFALFEWTDAAIPTPPTSVVTAASAETSSSMLTGAASKTGPIALDGPLTFLGVKAHPREDMLAVETWWQVTEGPVTRPFSIMAHLLDGDGATTGVADGFGVPPLVLEPGDVVVQRHRFPMPSQETNIWLRTGAYWLDSGDRWTCNGAPGADAVFVKLEPD
jgi:hypothetical protein